MTNEKINATVEEIMEYEALLDEVKGIVDGLKDNLKNEMAERKVESLSTDRYTVRWTVVLISKFNSKEFKKGDDVYMVAQHETVTLVVAMEREAEYREFLKAKVAENGYKFALLLVTDIFTEGSKFICEGDVAPVSEAFGIDATKAEWVDGILSRKKQVIPPPS